MQFEDPRSILEAAAAKPTRGIDVNALTDRGRRMRRGRYAAVAAGLAVTLAGATAAVGMLGGGRPRPGPAAAECDPQDLACLAQAWCLNPPPDEAAVFLREEASRAEVRRLRDALLDRPGIESVEYVSKDEAYDEFQQLYEGEPYLWETINPGVLPASLRIVVSDAAAGESLLSVTSPAIDEIRSGAGLYERLCGKEGERPAETPAPEKRDPAAGTVTVEIRWGVCRTGNGRAEGGTAELTDGSKWCRFVLGVDNRATRQLRLEMEDVLLRTSDGEATVPWEDAMFGPLARRLFESPVRPGDRVLGQVTFLLPPGGVPATLEIEQTPGFAPASLLVQYDCVADLRDVPGRQCSFEPNAERASLRQTWARTEVSLWHCGVDPVVFGGREWVVPDPPFDATNAPEGFIGRGTFKQRSSRDALFFDDGGEIVHFEAIEDWEPPVCN